MGVVVQASAATAGVVFIDSAPAPRTSQAGASFVFHATEGASGFRCSLDGADFMPCTSPATYYDLTQGRHLFQVEADGARPAAQAWTIAAADLLPEPPCGNGGCFDINHAMAVAQDLSVGIGIRYPNTAGDTKAQQYLSTAFTGYGLNVQLQKFALPQGGYTDNVIASSAQDFNTIMNAGRFVMVDAHFDTSKSAPGGNDNGSGTGSMVEFARALQAQPATLPVIFAGFGAEEIQPNGSSRLGSSFFVNHMTAAQKANLVALVNMDMIGHGTKVLLRYIGGPKEATNRLVSLAQSMGITTSVVNLATSDETPFVKAGLNVGSLRGETPSCYDVPCDTFSTIEPAEVERAARLGLAEVRSYDATPFWTRTEDGASGVRYSGTGWARYSSSCASGGTYHASQSSGNVATFSFFGIGARWISTFAPNLGKAQVLVDGASQGTFDLYAATQTCQVVSFELTGLAPGAHKVQVKVLGTRNPSSTSSRIVVDAFESLH